MHVNQQILRALSILALFLCIFGVLYTATNAPALYTVARYRITPPTPTATMVAERPTSIDTTISALRIPRIGVDAPITWDIAGGDPTVPYLDRGIAHLKGSAEPGENGNLFLTGHSSDYPWKKNPYGTVFTLIGELKQGDDIIVVKNGKSYRYKMAGKKVVSPYEVSVADATSTPTITLMTCFPIGSTAKRLIVTGIYSPISDSSQAQGASE